VDRSGPDVGLLVGPRFVPPPPSPRERAGSARQCPPTSLADYDALRIARRRLFCTQGAGARFEALGLRRRDAPRRGYPC